MKKLIFFICLFAVSAYSYAQPVSMTIGNVSGVQNTSVSVPITVTNFSNIGAITLKISFDPSAVSFESISNTPGTTDPFFSTPPASANANGQLIIGWYSLTPLNLGNSKLLDMVFKYKKGSSAIAFSTADCEIINATSGAVTVTYTSGAISSNLNLTIKHATATPGSKVSVPLEVLSFMDVGALSLKINYDPAVVMFDSLGSLPRPKDEFTVSSSGGVLSIGWFGLTPINIASGKLCDVYFTYVSGTTQLTFNTAQCEISNSTATPLTASYNNGSVSSGTPITLALANVKAAASSNITVPLNVTNFSNIGAISLKINFDPAVLSFTGISNAPAGIDFLVNVSGNTISIGRYGTDPINVGTGKLFDLNFTYTDGSSYLIFNIGQCEIADKDGAVKATNYTNGSVVLCSLPAVPALASPSNGAMGISTSPTLSWQPSIEATSYRLQLSTSLTFSTTVFDQSNITGTSQPISGLINNTLYYWRVNATNGCGTSNYSEPFSFTTIVGIPDLVSPTNGATNQPLSLTLSWGAVTGAATYRIQVATDNSFTNLIVNDPTVTGTTKQVDHLMDGTQYFWRVNATNVGGTSDFSVTFDFRTMAVPGVPVLVSPSNGATNQILSLTLLWNAVTGAATYRIQVSTSSTFSTTVFDQSITDTSLRISGLVNNTLYYWRVNATNIGGTSNYSEPFHFTTIAVGNFYISPNPYDPNVPDGKLTFTLSHRANVTVEVFDWLGRSVNMIFDNKSFEAGTYTESYSGKKDGNILANGVYFLRMTVREGDLVETSYFKSVIAVKE
jgi:hypothetical protein